MNEYGRALARIEEFPLGAPVSLLPRRKEEIEAAIIHYAKILFRAATLTGKTYASLYAGYRELAHFIPDREAYAGATAWAALQSADSSGYSDETARAMDRHQEILAEKSKRGAEFDATMAREEVSMGLLEQAP